MSEALHGTVTMVIGARTYTLQPTLEAALKIEARFGGLRPALESLRMLGIGACADIVIAGAGLKPEDHAALGNDIFHTGVAKVSTELTQYLTVLLSPVPPSVVERGKPEADSTAQ